MKQPEGHNLAELNIGRLLADTDDPRVADFMNNLDRINGLGKRMPGFVWMSEGSGEPGTGNTEMKIAGDPRFILNMTVWADAASLKTFVFDTLHAKFMERKSEWFEILGEQHFAMWWVPEGHEPTLQEGLEKLAMRERDGDTDSAFGWDTLNAHLKEIG